MTLLIGVILAQDKAPYVERRTEEAFNRKMSKACQYWERGT